MDVRPACGRLGGYFSSSDVREPKAFPQRKVMQTYLDDMQLHHVTQFDAVFAGKDSFTHFQVPYTLKAVTSTSSTSHLSSEGGALPQ